MRWRLSLAQHRGTLDPPNRYEGDQIIEIDLHCSPFRTACPDYVPFSFTCTTP
jgi:hypothetical protein